MRQTTCDPSTRRYPSVATCMDCGANAPLLTWELSAFTVLVRRSLLATVLRILNRYPKAVAIFSILPYYPSCYCYGLINGKSKRMLDDIWL